MITGLVVALVTVAVMSLALLTVAIGCLDDLVAQLKRERALHRLRELQIDVAGDVDPGAVARALNDHARRTGRPIA